MNQADQLHSQAAAALGAGQAARAAELMGQAAALRPNDAKFQADFGVTLMAAGRLDEALAALRKAATIAPELAGTQFNLGVVLAARGQNDEAIDALQRCIAADPNHFQALSNLGQLLLQAKRFDEAVSSFRGAIRLQPTLAELHLSLATALREQGTLNEAIASACRALQLRADYPEALDELGVGLHATKQFDEAIESFERAITLRPQYAQAHSNLGGVLKTVGRIEEAIHSLRKALSIKDDLVEARANLAMALHLNMQLPEAQQCYEQSLAQQPDLLAAHLGLSTILLQQGNYLRGWEEHEWRLKWSILNAHLIQFKVSRINPGELAGKRVLIEAEQGAGDTLQFVRYASLIAERGAKLYIACPPMLKRVFQSIGNVERVLLPKEPMPPMDYHWPMMSLPYVFGTTLETIPNRTPYLFAEPAMVQQWAQRLREFPGKKVGLVWAGNPDFADDANRSTHLSTMGPLTEAGNVCFVSLQKGQRAEQAKSPPDGMRLVDWTSELTDYADTAALIMNLDLVIGVDTSVAHLAAALAKPTWVLLPWASEFRWMLNRNDSPWYPTMRLFRQKRKNDWSDPIKEVLAELAKI